MPYNLVLLLIREGHGNNIDPDQALAKLLIRSAGPETTMPAKFWLAAGIEAH